MMRAPLPRSAALALLVLVPLAAADHAFSHRVYVTGRVLDAEGRPAAGVPVSVSLQGVPPPGRCLDETPEATGAMGDYAICRHVHALPANASVTVRAGDASQSVPLDPETRRASAYLQVSGEVAHDIAGERTFARTYLVAGASYAMLDAPAREEGVFVNATTRADNVTVALLDGARLVASGNATPDDYGLFQLQLDATDLPPGARVQVRSGLALAEEPANAQFRRTDVGLLEDLRLLRGPRADAPGSDVPALAWGGVGALALVALSMKKRRGRTRVP